MKLRKRSKKRDEENLIPLINVVFLMLIFFLAAGTLRSFQEEGVKPAQASIISNSERLTEPVLISASGQITVKGIEQDEASLVTLFQGRLASGANQPLAIVADRDLPASKLVDVIQAAKNAGIKKIRLVTRKRKTQ